MFLPASRPHILRFSTGALALLSLACGSTYRLDSLPPALGDDEFWRVSTEFSEPAGAFAHSDNLVSNELEFANTISVLRRRPGAYIGVGPEQNFSYIARIRPDIAFIVDIRAENRSLHLLYKALFELSSDRADFVSRLFSRPRPAELSADAPVRELFARYADMPPSRALLDSTRQMVREHLLETHAFRVSGEELAWIDRCLDEFFTEGPGIRYASAGSDPSARPTYRALMTATDIKDQPRSYLATDDGFAFVKRLQTNNLIVPIVGDFAGPTAIRRVGDYVRQHGGLVGAFYSSNVEVYLSKEQSAAFCANLDALPSSPQTWFIHGKGMRLLPAKLAGCFFKRGPPLTDR